MTITPEEYDTLTRMLYERTGIRLEPGKQRFLESRLERRLEATRYQSIREYVRHLQHLDTRGGEFQKFVEEVTTNETYFFRDYPQLMCFANSVLPLIAEAKRAADDYTLNIWSACCSTGDEPYTLAIILAACLDDFPRWRIHILGTDIDTRVLGVAREARYGDRNVKDVPQQYLRQYFTREPSGWRVKPEIRSMVQFDQHNLMEAPRSGRFKRWDCIFCRNALIYFDDASRRKVLADFFNGLQPGGFVMLGFSESVARITDAFEPVPLDDNVVYRRPKAPVLARRS